MEALVKGGGRDVTRKIEFTLPTSDWATIAEGAAVNGWTLDAAVQHLFETNTEACEWFNEGYHSPTEDERERRRARINELASLGEEAEARALCSSARMIPPI